MRKTRGAENSQESKAKNYLPGFHIFQATGGLENLREFPPWGFPRPEYNPYTPKKTVCYVRHIK